MDNKDFEKKLETMSTPEFNSVKPPVEIKLAIINTRRSATIGFWFIVTPVIFILFAVLKYYFNINLRLLEVFENTIHSLDKNPATWWIQPLLLVILPAVGIALNLLSISHFRLDRNKKELAMTFNLRWWNLVILAISAIIILAFLLFLIGENFQGRPGHG